MEYSGIEVSYNTTAVMTGVAALLLIFYLRSKREKLPPGPFAFPVIGNLPQIVLSGSLVKFCKKYREIYGEVWIIK